MQAETALAALLDDYERTEQLTLTDYHRVTQRRGLSINDALWVLEQLVAMALLDLNEAGSGELTNTRLLKVLEPKSYSPGAPDGMSLFMKRVGQTKLLSADQEVDLGRRVQSALALDQAKRDQWTAAQQKVWADGMSARDAFISANVRLAVAWARHAKFTNQGIDYEDLVQTGTTGLIRAVEKFDPNLGYKFSTYAVWWIRQALSREIANTGRAIRIPVHAWEDIRRIGAASRRLEVELGRSASIREIADQCDMTVEKVAFLLDVSQDMLSLDMPVSAEEGAATLGTYVEEQVQSVEEIVEFSFLQEQLDEVLETLTGREAEIIRMRFGMRSGEPMTLDEIGKAFGVTRERIRQIEKKCLSKLRHPTRSQVLKDYLFEPSGIESLGSLKNGPSNARSDPVDD